MIRMKVEPQQSLRGRDCRGYGLGYNQNRVGDNVKNRRRGLSPTSRKR